MNFSDYTTKTVEQTLKKLAVSRSGVSHHEVSARQRLYGNNEITGRATRWYDILIRQLTSPFLYLLIFAAILAFFLGESIDSVMILIFVGINTVLGFYQEYHSERTLRLLKRYVLTKAKVIRSGNEITVLRNQLVPGDIVSLVAGDIIPADIRFIETQNIMVDESILTGESAAVTKITDSVGNKVSEIYQAANIGFSGTVVVRGEGIGAVFATGKNTTIGDIASLTTETRHQSTFEKGIARFSAFILRIIIFTLVFVVLMNIVLKGSGVNISTLLIFAIALAVSVIPEALPLVTTFSLSRGALHLAKNKVVVRRLSSIEDLGSIEVLATDKTGTITENRLSVDSIYPAGDKSILVSAALATSIIDLNKITDSFDLALTQALSASEKELFSKYQRLKEIPFDPERKRNSVLVKKDDKRELIVRGAPEIIISLCRGLGKLQIKKVTDWYISEGKQGKRVIAVAKKDVATATPNQLEKIEENLQLTGLISLSDPLKKSAAMAIRQAEILGVKIKIITGDSLEVAGAVASKIGLIDDSGKVISGNQFEEMTVSKQHEAAEEYSVFARVSPGQKHKIIQLLKEKHEVGFLGEGINDAPALKAANVAIVVDTASDISREEADIVLLHKSLNVIVDGIREGREIFANTAKYIRATLASNFGNFYTVAIVSLFIDFLPLLPIQILLINLLTDFPMIAVATDNVDPDELKRPKNYEVKEIILVATFLGVVSTIFDFMYFLLFYRISPGVLQTNWFIGSVLTELLFLFSIRTRFFFWKSKSPSLILIILTSIAFLTAIILPLSPIGRHLFGFVRPGIFNIYLIILIAVTYFVTTEIVKLLYYQYIGNREK